MFNESLNERYTPFHLDVLSSLEDSIKQIDATRIIQVSMDGLNTNPQGPRGISEK